MQGNSRQGHKQVNMQANSESTPNATLQTTPTKTTKCNHNVIEYGSILSRREGWEYLSPRQPTRPAPRSPAPAADIELPEQTLVPPCPRPWMQPLCPLEGFPHPKGELWQFRRLLSPPHLPPYPASCRSSSCSSSSGRESHQQNMIDEATASGARERARKYKTSPDWSLSLDGVGFRRLTIITGTNYLPLYTATGRQAGRYLVCLVRRGTKLL